MTLRLSAAGLRDLEQAIRLLSHPLDFPTIDAWRSAANSHLRRMFNADSAGFLLPGTGTQLFYSEEHDPAEIGRYADYHPPAMRSGETFFERCIRKEVVTIDSGYGRDSDLYWNSPYYNEYAAPNGAADTLATMIPLGAPDPRTLASIHLWRTRDHERFSTRDIGLMRLLYPAMQAGVATYLRIGRHADTLFRTCDSLGYAMSFWSDAGQLTHQTPALTTLLNADPESGRLRGELAQLAASAVAVARGQALATAAPALTVQVRTAHASYALRATHQAWDPGRALVLIAVERTPSAPRPMEDMQARFRLTPAEARVAKLLADGKRNADIAAALSLSGATVRRHTERIFSKLDVKSRAEAAAVLLGRRI